MSYARCCIPKECKAKWPGHVGGTNMVAWLPPSYERFVSVGADSKVKVWSSGKSGSLIDVIERRKNVGPYGHSSDVKDVSASKDGTEYATASADKWVFINCAEKNGPKIKLPHEKCVSRVSYPVSEQYQRCVLSLSGNKLYQWDLRTAGTISVVDPGMEVLSFCFVNDDSDFIISSTNGVIQLFQWKTTNKPLQTLQNASLPTKITSIAQMGKKNLVCLGSNSSISSLYVLDSPRVNFNANLKCEAVKHLNGNITVSPDAAYITVGDKKGRVHFWERKSGKRVDSIEESNREINGAVWKPSAKSTNDKGSCLIYGSSGEISLWEY